MNGFLPGGASVHWDYFSFMQAPVTEKNIFVKKWSLVTRCQFHLWVIPVLSLLPLNHFAFSLRVLIIPFPSLEQGALIKLLLENTTYWHLLWFELCPPPN